MYVQPPKFKDIWHKLKNAWHKSKWDAHRNKSLTLGEISKTANRTIWSDIACGWHSGFRPCCILFFLIWSRILPRRVMYFVSRMKLLTGFRYIPCPLCYLMNQKLLEPRQCDCDLCPDETHSHEWCKLKLRAKKD